jgi:hypothetical protein
MLKKVLNRCYAQHGTRTDITDLILRFLLYACFSMKNADVK